MKLISTLYVCCALLLAAAFVTPVEDKEVCGSGICVVEFNASFNSQNSVPWIERLDDCETARVDIATAPDLQKEVQDCCRTDDCCFQRGGGTGEVSSEHHDDDGRDH